MSVTYTSTDRFCNICNTTENQSNEHGNFWVIYREHEKRLKNENKKI